jgi:hypothetical protein
MLLIKKYEVGLFVFHLTNTLIANIMDSYSSVSLNMSTEVTDIVGLDESSRLPHTSLGTQID